VIDPDAGDAPLLDEAAEELMDGREDRGILDAQPGQRVDVEEPAVVDLVREAWLSRRSWSGSNDLGWPGVPL
jgi:hypothetical protein